MINPKHTAGPWYVEKDDGVFVVIDDAREMDPIYLDQENDEREANARLIAAAPELLGALEKAAELAKPGQEMGLRDAIDALCDVWNIARAAIAKAEGK